MARGKHGNAAARRRDAATAAHLDDLATQLVEAAAHAAAAEAAAREADELTARLQELEKARDAAVAAEVGRLAAVLDELEAAIEVEEDLERQITAAWSALSLLLRDSYGGGVEALEHFLADSRAMQNRPTVRRGIQNDHLPVERVWALQKARGIRGRSDQPTPKPVQANPPTDWLAERIEDHPRGRPTRNDRGLIAAWWLACGVELTWCDAVAGFGAVNSDSADRWAAARPAPAPYADEITRATFVTAPQAIPRKRWPNPLVPPPLFPRTSDAAALRWWFWVMAGTEEIAADLSHLEERAATMPTHGPLEEPPVSPGGRMWREAAHMLASSTLFWLPPGQVVNYLASQPLEAADVDDIRLPYQRVFVVPAEPLVLDPMKMGLDEDDHRAVVDAAVVATKAATSMATAVEDIDVGRSLDLETALRACGANVEGVVLEADASGRPGPRVIWCLAIPTPDRTATIARVVIPAWRDATVWKEPLDQLAAVAAWGDWVEPPEGRTPSRGDHATHHGTMPAPSGSSWLRVLDVKRTEGHGGGEPTGRTIAPHVRRGHWRRQHYGAGGVNVKRVRIAPTLVNAGQGPLAPRVYRLPAAPQPSGLEEASGG
jgi:hypothetical protein